MRTLIYGGTLIYASVAKKEDILIEDGKIKQIKASIRPRGDEHVVDGSSYYIMPGFISTVQDASGSALKNGVTTEVKRISDVYGISEQAHGNVDFVYQVSLPRLTKESLDVLDRNRVKVIEADWKNIDWDIWLPRLSRMGMVLSVKEEDFKALQHLPIPMLVPYGKWKKTNRPRTVFQIHPGYEQAWKRQSATMDPYMIRSYWLDHGPFSLPRQNRPQNLEKSLILTANIRSRIPSRLYGVYPQKGSLHAGADADLLFADKDRLPESGGQPFAPDRMMYKGSWMQDEGKNGREGLVGNLVKGNQTYAFSF